jgi:hypothetical protein
MDLTLFPFSNPSSKIEDLVFNLFSMAPHSQAWVPCCQHGSPCRATLTWAALWPSALCWMAQQKRVIAVKYVWPEFIVWIYFTFRLFLCTLPILHYLGLPLSVFLLCRIDFEHLDDKIDDMLAMETGRMLIWPSTVYWTGVILTKIWSIF